MPENIQRAADFSLREASRGLSAVGGELDVTLKWANDRHQSLLVGYSHLWPGSFIDQTGDNDAPDLFYLQYTFTF